MTLRSALPILFSVAFYALFVMRSNAQLVFVPDVDLRAEINSAVPGAVNASGYIDTTDPVVLAATSLVLDITWSPADLTGVEAFPNLELLYVYCIGAPTSMSITAWPPALV